MMVNDVTPAEIVTTVSAPRVTVLTRIKSGMASWYGSVLQGHRTASGRRFDMNELTAAHRTFAVWQQGEGDRPAESPERHCDDHGPGGVVPGAGDRPVAGCGEGAADGEDGRRSGAA